MESLNREMLSRDANERRLEARGIFDRKAERQLSDAHPLIRQKYSSKEHLPFYFLQRERAVAYAVGRLDASNQNSRRPITELSLDASRRTGRVEHSLTSGDGVIYGKPDLVNASEGWIVDYKTGASAEPGGDSPSAREKRQLALYVYLTYQNGINVTGGKIVRSNGQEAIIRISEEEAESEASIARGILRAYNTAAGLAESFVDLATPSKDNCQFCPCIPFCDAFWRESAPWWQDLTGANVEGEVSAIQRSVHELPVLTLTLSNVIGTVEASNSEIILEQLPQQWLSLTSESLPTLGERVRVVDARKTATETPVIIRADRGGTTVWVIPRSSSP